MLWSTDSCITDSGVQLLEVIVFFKFSADKAPVVQKVDSALQRINLYPLDSAIGFPATYPLDSDLSGG